MTGSRTETAKLEALIRAPFEFDRYINGELMAEGVTIERDVSLVKAMSEAARIASRGPNGKTPVLVLRKAATALSILSSLSPPTGGWQPIATADKSIAVDMQFPSVPRMLHSYPIWVRCDGGEPFEASWCQRKADRPDGYWWAWDAEDVVDPDEWMPHPLQPLHSPPEAE